jgi:hypothetical protein
MDYEKAIENLKNILTDVERFAEINKSIFDAIDTDNSGTLEKEEVEDFMKDLLRGIENTQAEIGHMDQNNNIPVDDRYRQVF